MSCWAPCFRGVGVGKNATPFSRNQTQVSHTVGRMLSCLSYQGSPEYYFFIVNSFLFHGCIVFSHFPQDVNNGSNIFLCKRFVFSKLLYPIYFNLFFSYTTGVPQIFSNPWLALIIKRRGLKGWLSSVRGSCLPLCWRLLS